MCIIILDECILTTILLVQLAFSFPAICVSGNFGIAFGVLVIWSELIAILTAFSKTFKTCCKWVTCLESYGFLFFILFELVVAALSIYGIYNFILPYMSKETFEQYCINHQLDKNNSHTGCTKLQGYFMTAVVCLTLQTISTFYIIVLGIRIQRSKLRNDIEKMKSDRRLEDNNVV